MHECELGNEEVEELVDNVVIAWEIDVDINGVFVSGVGRVNAGDVVVFYEHWGVGGGGGLEGKWALEVLSGGWVVEVDGVCG